MNTEIIWNGECRTIPNYGVVENGDAKTLPKDLADSFIKQGLATAKVKTKSTRKQEVE